MNKALALCLFDPEWNANNISSSKIKKYDYDFKFISQIEFDCEINFANVHQDKLYLLATSSDRQSKHIYDYDESLTMLEKIHLSSSEGLPLNVPYSVSKMRVADDYFVFLDGKKVLLMDRVDGEIKRTISIGSNDGFLNSIVGHINFV